MAQQTSVSSLLDMTSSSNVVFLGEAGSGKSEIALNFAQALAELGGKPVHFFDLDMGLIAGLLFAVGILLLGRPLLILLQSPTLEEATAYLSICGVGLLFIFVYNSLSAILRGVGNSASRCTASLRR